MITAFFGDAVHDANRSAVIFYTHARGRTFVCRVSETTLLHLAAGSAFSPMEIFHRRRSKILFPLCDKIVDCDFDVDDGITIRPSDLRKPSAR